MVAPCLMVGTAVFDDLRQAVKNIEFLADPTVGEIWVGSNARAAYAVACRKNPESFVVLVIKAQILRFAEKKPPRRRPFVLRGRRIPPARGKAGPPTYRMREPPAAVGRGETGREAAAIATLSNKP
jgi:hypothetical protein